MGFSSLVNFSYCDIRAYSGTAFVRYTNDTGSTKLVTELIFMSGTGSGTFTAGDTVTGDGSTIICNVTAANKQSKAVTITNVLYPTSGGYPDKGSMLLYKASFENNPVSVDADSHVDFVFNLSGGNCFLFNQNEVSGTVINEKYEIVLDGNNGTIYDPDTGVVSDKLVEYKNHDIPYIIPNYIVTYKESDPDTTQSRAFQGYATSKTASSPEYKVGASYTDNKPITLYAIYETSTYTVEFFDGYSNTLLKRYENVAAGSSVTPPATPTRPGHTFSGWFGDYTNITSDRKIVAMWGFAPIWVMTPAGWSKYEPKES